MIIPANVDSSGVLRTIRFAGVFASVTGVANFANRKRGTIDSVTTMALQVETCPLVPLLERLSMFGTRWIISYLSLVLLTLFNLNSVCGQRTEQERKAVFDEFKELKSRVKELKVMVKTDKAYEKVEKFLAKKIEVLKEEKKLSDKQVKHLQLAARGAVERHMTELRRLAEDPDYPIWVDGMEEIYCRSGDIVYLGNNPEKNILLHHPIWQNAVQAFQTPDELEEEKNRKAFRESHLIETCLLHIDKQLKLTHRQRTEVRRVLTEVVSKELKNIRYNSTDYLPLPISHALQNLPPERLDSLLTEKQRQKWNDEEFDFGMGNIQGIGGFIGGGIF